MDTNWEHEWTRMDTNELARMDTNMNADGKLILKDEVYAIVGCAFAVLNELGHCGKEKIYENALCAEMRIKGIPFAQQPRYTVMYKGTDVGVLIPDLVAYDSVIVDTKVVPEITDRERCKYSTTCASPVFVSASF
jgi:GxxExxY protein